MGQIYVFIKVNYFFVTTQGHPWQHVLLLQKKAAKKPCPASYLLVTFQAGWFACWGKQWKSAFNMHMFWPKAKDSESHHPKENHWCFLGAGEVEGICALEMKGPGFSSVPFHSLLCFLGKSHYVSELISSSVKLWNNSRYHCCELQGTIHQIMVYSKCLLSKYSFASVFIVFFLRHLSLNSCLPLIYFC